MIYTSTSCLKSSKNILRVLNEYEKLGIENVELGSVHSYFNIKELKKFDFNYTIHNYFPPPKIPFNFNLASQDKKIKKNSISLAKKAIDLCRKIDSSLYTFHAGFVESLPHKMVVETTYDVVSHCLDSLHSKKATEKSIEYCNEAIELLRNKKNNFDLIKAGHTAGNAIEITGTNLLHSLSYPLTGHYRVSHGMALGYFLPKILKFIDYDVSDIIEDFNLELDVDIDFIIDEALKYDKINEFKIFISKEILQKVLK